MSILDEETFEEIARQYQHRPDGRVESSVLAFDGKRERGTIPPGETEGEALLAVYAPDQQEVIAQGRIDPCHGEIPAAQAVLQQVDLHGKIVLGDALHSQRDLSEYVVKSGGDFLWTIKQNQPNTYQDIEKLFTAKTLGLDLWDFQTAQTINKSHGRIVKRTLSACSLLKHEIDWPFVGQVFRLERQFTFLRKGQTLRIEHMLHYGLTSLTRAKATPSRLPALKRAYWQIETGLHYRRDVTFHEDATRSPIPMLPVISRLSTTLSCLYLPVLAYGMPLKLAVFSMPTLNLLLPSSFPPIQHFKKAMRITFFRLEMPVI